MSAKRINILPKLLNRVREAQITDDDEATLKHRVTTLDDPGHFTDALHVHGTNNQTDQIQLNHVTEIDYTEAHNQKF